MPVPQELAELPYAAYLRRHEGELTPDGDYTEVLFVDAEFEGFDLDGGRLSESAATNVTFRDGRLVRAELRDLWCTRTRWIGVSLAESRWQDVSILDSLLAGVEAYGSVLRRVTLQRCKVDTLNLRGATLRDVVFDHCELGEVDFAGTTLHNVSFPGSALRRARFGQARLTTVDLRGATELDVADGVGSLGGALIDRVQLTALAPALAQALGIVVEDG